MPLLRQDADGRDQAGRPVQGLQVQRAQEVRREGAQGLHGRGERVYHEFMMLLRVLLPL